MTLHTIHTKKQHYCNFNTMKTIKKQNIEFFEENQEGKTFALIFLVKTR